MKGLNDELLRAETELKGSNNVKTKQNVTANLKDLLKNLTLSKLEDAFNCLKL